MRPSTRPTGTSRWVLLFLAATVAIWATVFGAAIASAATGSGAETRVGASTQEFTALVGASDRVTAGQQLGKVLAGPGIVVATGVAANSADEALPALDDVLGGLSKGRSSGVRTVGSDAQLDEVHTTLTRGGTPYDVPGYKGTWIERSDGVRIGLRDVSKSGGRTIDIRYPDGTTGKVHIE